MAIHNMRKKGTKVMGNNGIELERDGFKSRTGFILACIGSAVGMGNIWRFPYMVSAWGGMTFLIPYVIFVILIGSTGVIEEMALGRATKGGPIKAFGDCMQMRIGKRKAGEAIGFIPVLGSLALAMGYTVVVGWIFKYTYLAFSGKLSAMGNDMSAIGGLFGSTASSFGNNMWLIIAMVVTIQEKLKLNRVASVGIIAVAGCVVSLVIQGIVSGWMDAVSIYICPLGAMLAAIMFFWVAGKKFAVDAVNAGADKPIGKWFVPLGKYVLVPLSLVALIAGALLGGIG